MITDVNYYENGSTLKISWHQFLSSMLAVWATDLTHTYIHIHTHRWAHPSQRASTDMGRASYSHIHIHTHTHTQMRTYCLTSSWHASTNMGRASYSHIRIHTHTQNTHTQMRTYWVTPLRRASTDMGRAFAPPQFPPTEGHGHCHGTADGPDMRHFGIEEETTESFKDSVKSQISMPFTAMQKGESFDLMQRRINVRIDNGNDSETEDTVAVGRAPPGGSAEASTHAYSSLCRGSWLPTCALACTHRDYSFVSATLTRALRRSMRAFLHVCMQVIKIAHWNACMPDTVYKHVCIYVCGYMCVRVCGIRKNPFNAKVMRAWPVQAVLYMHEHIPTRKKSASVHSHKRLHKHVQWRPLCSHTYACARQVPIFCLKTDVCLSESYVSTYIYAHMHMHALVKFLHSVLKLTSIFLSHM